jgi:transposase-like protein
MEQAGATVDLLQTTKQKHNAASRFLRKAAGRHYGAAKKITIDKHDANTPASESYSAEHEAGIEIRRIKYRLGCAGSSHGITIDLAIGGARRRTLEAWRWRNRPRATLKRP